MKKIYITLLCAFALISTNTNAQVQLLPSCNPPAELLATYDNDIRSLAIRYAWQANLPDTALIDPSPALYNLVANSFAAIYNSNYPARDSVFDKYCVHDWGNNYSSSLFLLKFNASHPWTAAWQNGQTVTGNTAVDDFFSRHQLEVIQAGGTSVYIGSGKAANMKALDDSLRVFPGISHAVYGGLVGDGNEINFSKNGNLINLDFSVRWEDCTSGCLNAYIWHFQVDDNCNATYLGSLLHNSEQVEPFPEPLNCNLFLSAAEPVSESLVQLFPNPTSGTVHIQTEAPLSGLKLYNATGSCVLQQPTGAELNMSHLPSGLYYFSGTDARGNVHTQRLVKN